MMNNFPFALPSNSIDSDSGTTIKPSDVDESSTGEFASMLATVWFGQAPAQIAVIDEVVASGTTEPVEAIEDLASEQRFKTSLPDPRFDADVVQSELTPDVPISLPSRSTDVPFEKVVRVPDISLPGQQAQAEKKPLEQDASETIPPLSVQIPAEVSSFPNQTTAPESIIPAVRSIVREPPIQITGPDTKPASPLQPRNLDIATTKIQTPGEVSSLDSGEVEINVDSDEPITTAGLNPEPIETKRIAPDRVTAEAIKREANIVASYLAQSARDARVAVMESVKTQLSGNATDSNSNNSTAERAAENRSQNPSSTIPAALESLSFAATFRKQSENLKETVGPQVTDQILELAATTSSRQPRSVRLRLRPEELGQVEIQLTRDSAGRVSAQLTVERENTRMVLTQSMSQLRDSLERAGLHVDRLEVTSDTATFSGDRHETREQSNDEITRSSLTKSHSLNPSETQSKERVREHKLLSLSA